MEPGQRVDAVLEPCGVHSRDRSADARDDCASLSAIAQLSVGIIFERRRPYFAVEASGVARADTAGKAVRPGRGAGLSRSQGFGRASAHSLMMFLDVLVARLASGCGGHGLHHSRRRTDGQRQKPYRM